MITRVENAIRRIPPGGFALHGTSYQKASSIVKVGLGHDGYYCPVPRLDATSGFFKRQLSSEEHFSRAIGACLFSASYALSEKHRQTESDPLPAIVVLGDWKHGRFNHLDNDSEQIYWRYDPGLHQMLYHSFGKNAQPCPPQFVCGIAHLDMDELGALSQKISQRSSGDGALAGFLHHKFMRSALVAKTLLLLEELTASESRPDRILMR